MGQRLKWIGVKFATSEDGVGGRMVLSNKAKQTLAYPLKPLKYQEHVLKYMWHRPVL